MQIIEGLVGIVHPNIMKKYEEKQLNVENDEEIHTEIDNCVSYCNTRSYAISGNRKLLNVFYII